MAKKKEISDDEWWEEEFRQRPDGSRDKIILGNCIRLTEPINKSQTEFKINSVKSFIECVRVLGKRVREKERTFVIFVSEQQLDIFKKNDEA